MIEDVILSIKDAEALAEENIRIAKENAKAQIDAVEADCAAKIAECKKQAKEAVKEAVSAAERDADELMAAKTESFMNDGKNELAGSAKKVDRAVAIVVERIMAKYGNR